MGRRCGRSPADEGKTSTGGSRGVSGGVRQVSQDWSRIAELVDQGLALPPAARPAWLDTLSRREPSVAPAVRRLIEARVAETETMASPVLLSGAAHAPGDRVGPYVLVELLGSGGM